MQSKGVAVFWDYESCEVPPSANGYDIAKSIRSVALTFGVIRQIKVYVNLNEPRLAFFKLPDIRSDLQMSGVSIVDCPKNDSHDNAIEMMMLVEMFAYVIDNPDPSFSTIILISGNRNFVYAMSTLRMRGFKIVLISPNTVHASLKAQASECLDWCLDVLYTHHMILQDDPSVVQVPENITPPIRPSLTATLPDNIDISTLVSPGKSSSAPTLVTTHSVDQLSSSKSLSSQPINQSLPGRNSLQPADITLAATLERPPSTSLVLPPDSPKVQSREDASTPSTQATSGTTSSSKSVPTHGAAPTVPVIYRPLVELLQARRAKGVIQPLRSHIAADLIKKHPNVYKSANVKKFSHYALNAKAAGIIDLGGKDGGAWVKLRSELQGGTR